MCSGRELGESITKQIALILDNQEGLTKQQNEENIVKVIIYLHLKQQNYITISDLS